VTKPFDATLNSLIDARPEDWVAFLAPRVGLTPGPAEVLDTDLSATVQSDKVFRLIGPPAAMIHLELEANPRLGIPADLLRYNVLTAHGREETVHSVILLLRPKANSSDLTGVFERVNLRFEYTVIRLWQESVDAVLSGGPTLAPLALLTNEAAAKLDETFDRFAARLRQPDVDGKLARELFGSTFVLSGLRYEPERIADLYRRFSMTLEDSTTYQWILKKGENKGLNAGRIEGLNAGRVEAARDFLLQDGSKKFGESSDAEAALQNIEDFARLRRIHARLGDSTDWDDLLSTP
jgi:predicted transposase YdaD